MQRREKSIANVPNMDPAWFALVERRINDRKRWRRFAHDRIAVYVGLAMQDAGAERTFLATDPSAKQ
jgi:hypothetical protein